MGAILNGIALHGGTRPYGGTFLIFSDYMRPRGPAGRADGAAGHLRLDPRLDRPGRGRPDPPADRAPVRRCGPSPAWTWSGPATPTRPPAAWSAILEHTDRPAGAGPDPAEPAGAGPGNGLARAEGVRRGGYVLAEADGGSPQVILIATGSEVQIALAARRAARRPRARRPGWSRCRAWSGSRSRTRPTASRCCPPAVKARVSVEAGIALGWRAFVGDAGEMRRPRALRRLAPTTRGCTRSSASPPSGVAAAARTASTRSAPAQQNWSSTRRS